MNIQSQQEACGIFVTYILALFWLPSHEKCETELYSEETGSRSFLSLSPLNHIFSRTDLEVLLIGTSHKSIFSSLDPTGTKPSYIYAETGYI